MSPKDQSFSQRAFRMLLRVFPMDFRENFGGEMEAVFCEQRHDVDREGGVMGLARLWWETLVGIFTTAPREHLSMLRQDVKYAFRMMRSNPGFTLVAVATLALGIGANTAIYSVIHAILLKPLPYSQGNQLVMIQQEAPKLGDSNVPFSVAEVKDYRDQNSTLSGLVEYHSMTFTLLGHGEARRVRTGVVSAGFFDLFGVRPTLGRTFRDSDEEHGAPAVLVLSYEYWQRFLGGDPDIVGKTFEMNDRVHTVVGVLPPVPQYPNENDVYMPTSACPYRSSPAMTEHRDQRMMRVFGRLKPGVSLDQSRADVASIASRLGKAYPEFYPANSGYTSITSSLREELTHQARPTLLVLLGAAGFVLLIACANVANMTLARMAKRERELVVRSALGANMSRLLRQLVTESSLIGLLAAGLGLLMASGSLKLLVEFAARLTPRAREIRIDGPVLLFTMLAAFGTSVFFGSVSAFSSRDDIASRLKEGSSQSTGGRGRKRARSVLIVLQVAFSIMLLVGAGLLMRSLMKLQRVDPGFVPQNVLSLGFNLNWSKYQKPEQYLDYARRLLQKVQTQPGMVSVAVSSGFPMDPDGILARGPGSNRFLVEGSPSLQEEVNPVSAIRAVTPDYFKTLGIPLVKGRAIAETDSEKAPAVAVINQSLAHHHWRDGDPLDKRISFDKGKTWMNIIGVVGDVKEFGLNKEAADELYLPMAQNPAVGSLIVRANGDPMNLAAQLRRTIHVLDPETAITNVMTLEQARSDTLASPRVMTNLLGLFAALALVIAGGGIGGILALTVSQRVHEIGIRMALGAKTSDVLRMVVGQGFWVVMLGVGMGLVGALALTDLLRSLLFEVTPTDPLTFVAAAALLVIAALVACYLPARRATRVDPLVALHYE
ncbi:MAG: ABC transporter permease [Acidobacteriia bacterium]|nr:ABC transporter permease [Terriglobia bacterium]